MKKHNLASAEDLLQITATYHTLFPSEIEVHSTPVIVDDVDRSLHHFLSSTTSEDLYHRKNFAGHLTASAFILDVAGKNVLLLHHKSLDRWLQPGGHIDNTDESILTAAYREVEEETGILKENLQLISLSESLLIPFDIDSHHIPANSKKGEAAHVHHDFRYLLQMIEESEVAIQSDESNDYRWVEIEELLQIQDHARVAKKITELRNA